LPSAAAASDRPVGFIRYQVVSRPVLNNPLGRRYISFTMASNRELSSADDRAAELEAYLHAQIPLSRAMGVRVTRADRTGVVLRAPLAPNLNHRQTFFGGSAASLATLAAWALAHERIREESGLDVHVVIQRSSMEYLEPATTEVQAECVPPPDEHWDRLLRSVRRWGKGRIRLTVQLQAEGSIVGSFEAEFVALA
jgi:thioesterase domain-containing protein